MAYKVQGKLVNTFWAVKKPIPIQCCYWDGGNIEEVMAFLGPDFVKHKDSLMTFSVKTLEGELEVNHPDILLLRGVDGEHYPCKTSIFERTYDAFLENPEAADDQASEG